MPAAGACAQNGLHRSSSREVRQQKRRFRNLWLLCVHHGCHPAGSGDKKRHGQPHDGSGFAATARAKSRTSNACFRCRQQQLSCFASNKQAYCTISSCLCVVLAPEVSKQQIDALPTGPSQASPPMRQAFAKTKWRFVGQRTNYSHFRQFCSHRQPIGRHSPTRLVCCGRFPQAYPSMVCRASHSIAVKCFTVVLLSAAPERAY